MEVAAVSIQEKMQARRWTQSVPRQADRGAGQQPTRFGQLAQKRPHGSTTSLEEKQHVDAVRRRYQDIADQQSSAPSLAECTYHPDENRQRQSREQTRGLNLGGIGCGGPSYRTALPPQASQHQTGIQPSTLVPSSSVFQQTFADTAAQLMQSTMPGGLQPMAPMAMAFGRSILLVGTSRGYQIPAMPMDTSGPMPPGGLQQGTTWNLPGQMAISPPQPPPARVVMDRDTGSLTYYGPDAAAALLFQQMQQTGWPRSGHVTYGTQ